MRKKSMTLALVLCLCLALLPAPALATGGVSYGPDARGYGYTIDKSEVDLGKITFTQGTETVNEEAFTLTITNTGTATISRKKTETLYLMAGAGLSIIEGEYEIAPGQSQEVTYGYRIRESARPGKSTEMLFFDFQGMDVEPVVVDIVYELERTDGTAGSSWSRKPINGAMEEGLVDDDDVAENLSTSAALSAPITREEFCHLACRTYEKLRGEVGEEQYAALDFSDCHNVEVRKMAALDVVRGVGGGRFEPDGLLTREQAATMLSRLALALGKPFSDSEPTFSDNGDISSWAMAAVGQMQLSGVMNGTGNNSFTPQGSYSWEQSVVTIYRLYDQIR